jgi:hypothetical protein
VNPQDLTDEQSWNRDLTDDECWKIWLAWGTDWHPNAATHSRDMMIDSIRKKLGPWFNIADLEYVERQFKLTGEHKLADWIGRRLQHKRGFL